MHDSLESAGGTDGTVTRPHPSSPTFQQTTATLGRSVFAVFEACPQCESRMMPEHAHFRCTACGWRDSCCD